MDHPFTYFTQFFWLCLWFLLIFRRFTFGCEVELSLRFLKLREHLHFIVIFMFCLLLLRSAYLVYAGIGHMLRSSLIFCILPTEEQLLSSYIGRPDQDPEWVAFVHQRLRAVS